MLVTSKEYVQGILEFGNRAPWARCESGSFLVEVLNLFKTMMRINDVRFDIHRLQILVQFSQEQDIFPSIIT